MKRRVFAMLLVAFSAVTPVMAQGSSPALWAAGCRRQTTLACRGSL